MSKRLPECFIEKIKKIEMILKSVVDLGGVPYLVGGSVRDLVLGREAKDIDIEVHNISLDDFELCLRKFGDVSLIGRQFGVLRLHGYNVDWSLPRKDSIGRRPTVEVDSTLTIEQACLRRDLTMNAMAIDLSNGAGSDFDVIDPYGGLESLKCKTLCMVDKEKFVQDPLRFYRVMQFVGRFEMKPDDALQTVCKNMDLYDVATGGALARERICEEMRKLLLKSRRPSLGFRWLYELGRLEELFPELGALVGVAQRSDYHPEGDVFEHTMQSVDAAAKLSLDDISLDEKFVIILGVLCHDFGKVKKTPGHDVEGVPLAKSFLHRFTRHTMLVRSICKLVRYHRMPITLVEQKSGLKAYKRLAVKLAPEVTAKHLYFVSWADIRGRNKDGHEPLDKAFVLGDDEIAVFLERIREAQVERGPEPPILLGRDLIDTVKPGSKMGELLKKAYKIQIDEGITDREALKKRVIS
ncbi:HD domain-containing protein [Candidatus Dependentiae bacterium]|nr:HD domain-containing protein [Candidatus Dependentiae bacterium]